MHGTERKRILKTSILDTKLATLQFPNVSLPYLKKIFLNFYTNLISAIYYSLETNSTASFASNLIAVITNTSASGADG